LNPPRRGLLHRKKKTIVTITKGPPSLSVFEEGDYAVLPH